MSFRTNSFIKRSFSIGLLVVTGICSSVWASHVAIKTHSWGGNNVPDTDSDNLQSEISNLQEDVSAIDAAIDAKIDLERNILQRKLDAAAASVAAGALISVNEVITRTNNMIGELRNSIAPIKNSADQAINIAKGLSESLPALIQKTTDTASVDAKKYTDTLINEFKKSLLAQNCNDDEHVIKPTAVGADREFQVNKRFECIKTALDNWFDSQSNGALNRGQVAQLVWDLEDLTQEKISKDQFDYAVKNRDRFLYFNPPLKAIK